MLQKTKVIVLRNIRFGETSLISTALTERFGIQSYIVNGVRTEKKGGEKASLYQPGSLLNIEAYQQEGRSVNRIKEASRAAMLHENAISVMKNSIVTFMMELLLKCLKHPEKNEELFTFCEDCLFKLDKADPSGVSIFPFYFAIKLPALIGFEISPLQAELFEDEECYLDLANGTFETSCPVHPHFLSGNEARLAARCLEGWEFVKHETFNNKAETLNKFVEFYPLHNPEFGKLKSLSFLNEMLSYQPADQRLGKIS